jgi:hypothetical protein
VCPLATNDGRRHEEELCSQCHENKLEGIHFSLRSAYDSKGEMLPFVKSLSVVSKFPLSPKIQILI